ncbi:MAG: hypothetical protein H6922_03405 [Pseudomonadaceae bacterium]|nr:hypothetical protein [Pseudomonadaceae bacterium]
MIPYPQTYQLTPSDMRIWHACLAAAQTQLVIGKQTFLFVTPEQFASVRKAFDAEPLRHGHWRSRAGGVHIHAVDEGDVINVHLDGSHPYAGPWAMLKHLYIDVIGTAIPTLWHFGRLALRPCHEDLAAATAPSARPFPGY